VAEQGTFFPVGDKGTWDGGMVFYAQPVELPGSDKLLIYYTGSWIRHDTVDDAKPEQLPVYNLGLALLRKEGYASIENDGRTAVGVLETKPIRFRGRRLFVNADASRGSVRVELCDASGKPLPGFHAGGAKPLTADNLGHVVEWGGTMDVSALAGKAIVVKFYLQKGAKLYSYRFDDPDPHRTEVAGVRR
jgi:hypothetical protein